MFPLPVRERVGVRVSRDNLMILSTLILAFSLKGRRDKTFATPSSGGGLGRGANDKLIFLI